MMKKNERPMNMAEWIATIAVIILSAAIVYTVMRDGQPSTFKPEVDIHDEYEQDYPDVIPSEYFAWTAGESGDAQTLEATQQEENVEPQQEAQEPQTETQIEPEPEPEPDPEPVWPISEEVPLSMELQQVLFDACQEHGVPVPLMLGLIEQESNFDPEADNGISYGLVQLNRAWWPDNLSYSDNLKTGIKYLGECLEKRNGDWLTALMVYHDGHVTGHKAYSKAVIARANRWENTL